jgi:NADH-quinone oxidoreductase subunit A
MTLGTDLITGLALFAAAGVAMVLGALLVGRLVRTQRYHPVKAEAYECGEPAIGSAWVQFDLRFYVAALVFLVFDAEIALLFPWAVVFREFGAVAFVEMLVFVGILAAGFAYLWRFGYLRWVRATRA